MSRAAWGWVFGWALLVEALLLWPHPPEVPQPFTFIGLDKLVHATLFGVQAALIARAMPGDRRRLWLAVIAAMVFGAITEFEQHFIPSRSMELDDFFADSVGAFIGASLSAVWARRLRELYR